VVSSAKTLIGWVVGIDASHLRASVRSIPVADAYSSIADQAGPLVSNGLGADRCTWRGSREGSRATLTGASAYSTLQQSHQPSGEGARIDRQFAVSDPGLVEQKMRGVRTDDLVTAVDRAQFLNESMTWIDLKHWLYRSIEPTSARKQLFELPVHPMFRRYKADRALDEAIGHTNVGDRITQGLLHEGDKSADRIRSSCCGLLAISERDQAKVGKTLGN